jgi:hypothetical protein
MPARESLALVPQRQADSGPWVESNRKIDAVVHGDFPTENQDNVVRPALPGDRVTRGTVARWSETTGWVDRDGLPLPDTMLVVGYITIVRRWKDNKPEDITEHPLPDPKQLNATIPVAEWEIGKDSKPREPWKLTYVIYMIDIKSGAIFTYANSTFGAKIAYEQLEERIGVMRLLRGEHVLPIVRLEKRPMKTQHGMKTRPHLQPIEWRVPGGGGPKLAPQPPSPPISGPSTQSTPSTPTTPTTPTASTAAPASTSASKPASTPTTPATAETASTILDHTKPVKPVTVAELIADELPPWA